jgi:hypothetical protein
VRGLALFALCIACKANDAPPPPQPVVVADAAPVEDWTTACEHALTQKQTPVRRIAQIIDGCRPHGDWAPILDWTTSSSAAVEAALTHANAFCTNDAKARFMNELEDARDKQTERPWRVLGDKCGDKVSAVPDVRFMSAPFFALDRIARATAANPKLAPLAAAVELPLPPVSMTGVGFVLATASVMKPEPPKWQVTVTLAEIRVGLLPVARLGAAGVAVELGASPYPGELADAKTIAGKVPAGERVLVIAPAAMPAQRLTEVVSALAGHELVLAVAASGGPKGWEMAGMVPVVLDGKPDPKAVEWKLDAGVDAAIADLKGRPDGDFAHPRITIAKDATVAHLAKLLGALAFRDARAASLTNAKK